MARKKKKDEVENYFNNVANYQTEAEARAVTPDGVKVFCAFDGPYWQSGSEPWKPKHPST